MLEYCLLGSLIAVALIAAVGSVGEETKDVYKEAGDARFQRTIENTG